jgi:hypothetical protein
MERIHTTPSAEPKADLETGLYMLGCVHDAVGYWSLKRNTEQLMASPGSEYQIKHEGRMT